MQLPNGSYYDESLPLAEQTEQAKAWIEEAFAQGEKLEIGWKNNGLVPFYSKILHQGILILQDEDSTIYLTDGTQL